MSHQQVGGMSASVQGSTIVFTTGTTEASRKQIKSEAEHKLSLSYHFVHSNN